MEINIGEESQSSFGNGYGNGYGDGYGDGDGTASPNRKRRKGGVRGE